MDFAKLREISGMTVSEFAAFLTCAPRTVENWEYNHRVPLPYVQRLIYYKLIKESKICETGLFKVTSIDNTDYNTIWFNTYEKAVEALCAAKENGVLCEIVRVTIISSHPLLYVDGCSWRDLTDNLNIRACEI